MMVSVFQAHISGCAFYEGRGGKCVGHDQVDLDGVRYNTSTYLWDLAAESETPTADGPAYILK